MADELEGPQPETEATAAPEPQPDPIQLAAQQLGVDPHVLVDSLRLQEENRRVYEENRRRDADNARREAALEARERQLQRFEPPAPNYDMLDPSVRPLYEEVRSMKQMFEERERREEQQRQDAIKNREMGAELISHYNNLMRTLPTQNQVDQQEFFERHMVSLYPGGVPDGMSSAQAVYNTAKFLGLNPNGNGAAIHQGYAPRTTGYLRDPRATIVLPGAGAASTAASATGPDASPQKPGETIEQYSQRIEQAGRIIQRQLQESGLRGLPKAYSSE